MLYGIVETFNAIKAFFLMYSIPTVYYCGVIDHNLIPQSLFHATTNNNTIF